MFNIAFLGLIVLTVIVGIGIFIAFILDKK